MGDQVRGRADYFAPGDWNVACSMCGRKRKASQMVKNWQGQWRCPEHNEPRQPQDFVRGVQDIQTPPFAQLEEDIDLTVCTFNGCSAIPGWAIPGCSIPGRTAIEPLYGLFSFIFTQNVAGLTAATLNGFIPFLAGTYRTIFTDGEIRNVAYVLKSATWSPALNSTPGLIITSAYAIIGND
jgi:hypothetical protein